MEQRHHKRKVDLWRAGGSDVRDGECVKVRVEWVSSLMILLQVERF